MIGGSAVQPGSWPSVAYVVSGTAAGRYRACTGTLVAANVVLTAAHCATEDDGTPSSPGAFEVVTGMVNQDDVSGARPAGVTAVFVHSAFDRASLRDDAALLVLDSSSSAPVMGLGSAAEEAPGARVAVAGWGVTSAGAPTASPTLQTAATTVQPDSACGDTFASFDSGTMLCAADTPSAAAGICNGDSGGPIAAMRSDGSWVQIGITSWGAKGCDTRHPGVFVRMSAISGWVADRIAGVPDSPAPAGPAGSAPSQAAPTPQPVRARGGSGGSRTGSTGTSAPQRYRGRTAQGQRIVLRLDGGGRVLAAVRADYRPGCTAGQRTLSARVGQAARHAKRQLALIDSTGSFSASGTAPTATHYRVSGTFSSPTRLTGTLRVRGGRVGGRRCDSGTVRYVAAGD